MSNTRHTSLGAIGVRGFTLLEILIALAILALLGSALAKQTSSSAQVYAHIQMKDAALSIAENIVEEIQLAELPAPGESSMTRQAGDQQFAVATLVERTPRQDMRKVIVSVRAVSDSRSREDADPLIQLHAFVGLN